MSASPPKADIERRDWHVRFVPIATERSAAKNYSSARPNARDFAERDLWNIDSGSASVHLDVEGADHLAPLLDFVSDELCEVAGRARQRLAEVSQTDLHLGVGEGRVDLLVELLDDLGWRVPGNADAIPRCRLVARHEFSHSGDIR